MVPALGELRVERREVTWAAVLVRCVQGRNAGMCRARVDSVGGELNCVLRASGEQMPGKAFLCRSVWAYPHLSRLHEPLSFATLLITELSQ